MNRHRITTDVRAGGMGLRQTLWTFTTRWVTLGKNETRKAGHTNWQLFATQYKYLDAVPALAAAAGRRLSRPRIHWPPAEGLFDPENFRGRP